MSSVSPSSYFPRSYSSSIFFFKDTASTEIYTLSLHDALPISLLSSIPSPKPAILFAIGRSYYGAEEYTQAERTYMRAANATKVPAEKAQYLWHAARAAQLRGDDADAEKLMTASIAIPGRSPSQTAA